MSMDLQIHKGVIARWQRKPDVKGFGILYLDRRSVPYIGTFSANIQEGDTLAMLVMPTRHARYGEQLQVRKVVMHLPGQWNLVSWLLQKFPHIGPVRAAEIEMRFGERIWSVLEEEPLLLTQVPGITEERVGQIVTAYNTERMTIEVYTQLLRLGVDEKVCLTLLRKEIPIVQLKHYLETDPYQLIQYEGVLFPHCDALGEGLKIPRTDRRRLRGFVVSELKKAKQEGHTMLHINKIKEGVRTQLRLSEQVLFDALALTPEERAQLEPRKDDVLAPVGSEAAIAYPPPYVFFGRYVQWRVLADHDAALVELLLPRQKEEEVSHDLYRPSRLG